MQKILPITLTTMLFFQPVVAQTTQQSGEQDDIMRSEKKAAEPRQFTYIASDGITLSNIFAHTANLSLSNSTPLNLISIRGVTSGGVTGTNINDVSYLSIDGRLVSTSQLKTLGDLFDIEDIHVYRNPQITTAEGGTFTGKVAVKTKDPTFSPDLSARLGVGNFNTYQAGIAFGDAITEDLAFRISLNHDSTDGYIQSAVSEKEDVDFRETHDARFKLLYEPSNQFRALLTGGVSDGKLGDFTSHQVVVQSGIFNWDRHTDRTEFQTRFAGLKIDYALSDNWSLESATQWSIFDENQRISGNARGSSDEPYWNTHELKEKRFTQSLSLSYETQKLKTTIGGYAAKNIINRRLHNIYPLGGTRQDNKTHLAVYGEIEYDVTDKLTAFAGLRAERILSDKITYTLPEKTYHTVMLPKVGVQYQFNDNHALTAQFTQGFRPGGIQQTTGVPSLAVYQPEYLNSYEFSYQGRLLNDSFRINANLFYHDLQDIQVWARSEDYYMGRFPAHYIANTAIGHTVGGELEAQWRVTPNLDIYASVGLARSQIDHLNKTYIFGFLDSRQFVNAPKATAFLGGSYTFGDWVFGAEIDHADDIVHRLGTEASNGKRTLVNLSATYRIDKNMKLTAFGNNIFDKKYFTEGKISNEFYPGAPRTFGLRFQYDY